MDAKPHQTEAQAAPAAGSTNEDAKTGHDFGAEYESDYTVPALTRQSRDMEAGLMSPHDIPESMPVLRAFHQFLEQERKRMQRRMMILAGVCVGIVAAVVLCGVLLIATYNTSSRYNNAITQRDLADVREDASKAKTVAESALGKFADKTDKLKDMLINNQQQAARSQAAVEQQQREMDSLRRQIELLQASRSVAAPGTQENNDYRKRQEELLKDLERTRAELLLARAAAEQPAQRAVEPRASPRREELPLPVPPPPAPPAPAVVAPVQVTTSAGSTTAQLPVTPRGTERPVQFRLPLP